MKLSFWTELIGIVAVVVSLGFLAGELSQANRLARFEAGATVRQNYNEMNLEIATNEDFADLLAVLSDPDPDMTEVQIQRAIGFAYTNMSNWELAERAYEEGWIPSSEMQNHLNDIRVATSLWPGLKPYLRMAVQETYEGVELHEVQKTILAATE